jgi:hypothetical protein
MAEIGQPTQSLNYLTYNNFKFYLMNVIRMIIVGIIMLFYVIGYFIYSIFKKYKWKAVLGLIAIIVLMKMGLLFNVIALSLLIALIVRLYVLIFKHR